MKYIGYVCLTLFAIFLFAVFPWLLIFPALGLCVAVIEVAKERRSD